MSTSTLEFAAATTATRASICASSSDATNNEQAAARLRDLIADGLASGPGRDVDDQVIAELRDRAFDDG